MSIRTIIAPLLSAVLIATVGIPVAVPVPVAHAALTTVNFANATNGYLTGTVAALSPNINWGTPTYQGWQIAGSGSAHYLQPTTAVDPAQATFTPTAGFTITALNVTNVNGFGVAVDIICGPNRLNTNVGAGVTTTINTGWTVRCASFIIDVGQQVRINTLTYDFVAQPTPVNEIKTLDFTTAIPTGYPGAPLTGIWPSTYNLLSFGNITSGLSSKFYVEPSDDPAHPDHILRTFTGDATFTVKTANTVLRYATIYNSHPTSSAHLIITCGGTGLTETFTVFPLSYSDVRPLFYVGVTACTTIRLQTDLPLNTEWDILQFNVGNAPPAAGPFGNTSVGATSFGIGDGSPVRGKTAFPYTAQHYGPYDRFNIYVDNLSVLGSSSLGGTIQVGLYNEFQGHPDGLEVNCSFNVPAATAGRWYTCPSNGLLNLQPGERYDLAVWYPFQNNFRPLFRQSGGGAPSFKGADSALGPFWGAYTGPNANPSNASFYMDKRPANSPPVIEEKPDLSIPRNTAVPIQVAISDPDGPNMTGHTMSSTSSNTTLVPNASVPLQPGMTWSNCTCDGGDGDPRIIVITPASNQTGTTTITIRVTDPGGLFDESDFILTVT